MKPSYEMVALVYLGISSSCGCLCGVVYALNFLEVDKLYFYLRFFYLSLLQ